MNNNTGEIIDGEMVETFKKVLGRREFERQFTPIPDSDLENVRGMNRHERRRWAKLNGEKKRRLK
jgi:hypothetical protein